MRVPGGLIAGIALAAAVALVLSPVVLQEPRPDRSNVIDEPIPNDVPGKLILDLKEAPLFTEGSLFLGAIERQGRGVVERFRGGPQILQRLFEDNLAAGHYTIHIAQRPCGGACGALDPPAVTCDYDMTINHGELKMLTLRIIRESCYFFHDRLVDRRFARVHSARLCMNAFERRPQLIRTRAQRRAIGERYAMELFWDFEGFMRESASQGCIEALETLHQKGAA